MDWFSARNWALFHDTRISAPKTSRMIPPVTVAVAAHQNRVALAVLTPHPRE